MVMTRAGVAELKANLSAYLRRVKQGETITVMDRNAPVAKLVGVDAHAGSALRVRSARASLATLEQPRRLRTRADIVALLLEERGER
jgi:prevent-host-death family protein